MDDREKAKKEYDEFLEFYYKRYGAEQETEESVPVTTQPQQEEPNALQEPNAGHTQPSRKPGTSSKPSAKKRRQRKMGVLSSIVLVALVLAVVFVVRLCTNGTDVLQGTWDLDGVTVYQFDGKGAGSLNLPSNSYAFTYEIKDNTLAIDFESEAAQDKSYTFVADKNKLTLTDNGGTDAKTFELTKQEK